MRDITSYYQREEGRILIEVKAPSVMRLFNSLDPAPIEEKVLDDATAEYIAGSAREVQRRRPVKLVLYLPPEEVWKADPNALVAAIHHHFEYRAAVVSGEFRQLLKRGWASLVIGLVFLFACVTAREFVGLVTKGTLRDILAEGLLISGWVAMWRPIQIFLYDWWPVRRQVRVYRRLSEIEVEVKPGGRPG